MRARGAAALATALVSLVPSAPAAAQTTTAPDRITMLTVFKTVNFGESTFVSGRFRNVNPTDGTLTPYTGRTLTLGATPFPFTTQAPVDTQATDIGGFYNFEVKPQINTRYQAVDPQSGIASEAKLIRVRFKADFEVDRTRIAKGKKVTLSGSALPARPGQKVEIDSRPAGSRRFKKAETTQLDEASRFEVDLKLKRDSELRAVVMGDEQNLPSSSRKVLAVTVGDKRSAKPTG